MTNAPYAGDPHRRSLRSRRAPRGLRLYWLALYAYPRRFRRAFGVELWQAARDTLEDAAASGSRAAVARAWLGVLFDLARNAALERITTMRRSIVIAPIVTGVAFVISLLASLNLYLLEDQNPLTTAAFQVSPLLRFSYDIAYLSAMAAGVAICAVVLHALLPGARAPLGAAGIIAVVVALASFGGLLMRAPLGFLEIFAAYLALLLLCLLAGWRVAMRLRSRLSARASAVVGACTGAGVALAVNAASVLAHTLALNPVSHNLYMQGQIPGTHYNSLLIAMGLQLLAILICASVLLFSPLPRGDGSAGGAASL